MKARTRILALAAAAILAPACDDPSSGLGHQDEFVTAAQCAAAKTWAEWTPYAIGTVVTYQGTTYRCIQAHTSQPGWTPSAVPALWGAVGCAGGADGEVLADPPEGALANPRLRRPREMRSIPSQYGRKGWEDRSGARQRHPKRRACAGLGALPPILGGRARGSGDGGRGG